MGKEYASVSLPASVAADLNRLKIAFGFQTGRIFTTGEIIAELISSLEKTNPAVYNVYKKINDDNIKLL